VVSYRLEQIGRLMLVLTRVEGSVIYGGQALTNDVDQTYDHMIRVQRIVDNLRSRYAVISIEGSDGSVSEHKLDADNEDVRIGQIRVVLIGIHFSFAPGGGQALVARIGIDAPRSYKIIRDDARNRIR
jgi:sRNA-binding carbon storage regulator CsrA